MEATRKRLEALLAELERSTVTAEQTMREVREALRELEDGRMPSPPDPALAAPKKR